MSHRSLLLHRAVIATGLLATLGSSAIAQAYPKDKDKEMKAMKGEGGELRIAMRRLWEDHITWTRLYIVAAAANLPEKEATAQRLLRNQTDIGNAIKPYYGDAAGDKLTTLLKGHIVIATEIIDAAMKGNEVKKNEAAKRWGGNADEIAGLLSGANPTHWPLAEMKGMMREHLELTTAEVVAELSKKWDESIAAYDRVKDQMMKMADALAAGIARQFPQRAN